MTTIKNIVIGSLCVSAGQVIFGIPELIIKLTDLKISQLILGRYVIQLIVAIMWWNINKPKSEKVNQWYGDTPYISNIWMRGFLHPIGMIAFYYAVDVLPIGDVQCIFYFAPLLLVFVAWMVLDEKLPNLFILIPATILVITGLFLLTQPPFLLNIIAKNNEYEPLNIYGIIALIIGVSRWTICVLLVRKAKDSHFLQLDIATSVLGLFIWIPVTLIINQYITKIDRIGGIHIFNEWLFDLKSIAISILMGICGFTALSLNVVGYQYGTATTVSWLEYINIPIGFIYQIYILNDRPNKYEMIGGSMITIACLLPSIDHLYSYCYSRYIMQYKALQIDSEETEESSQCEFEENVI